MNWTEPVIPILGRSRHSGRDFIEPISFDGKSREASDEKRLKRVASLCRVSACDARYPGTPDVTTGAMPGFQTGPSSYPPD